MQSLTYPPPLSQVRLRALVEIIDGELKVYPIASSDLEERQILDGLRFFQWAPDER